MTQLTRAVLRGGGEVLGYPAGLHHQRLIWLGLKKDIMPQCDRLIGTLDWINTAICLTAAGDYNMLIRSNYLVA